MEIGRPDEAKNMTNWEESGAERSGTTAGTEYRMTPKRADMCKNGSNESGMAGRIRLEAGESGRKRLNRACFRIGPLPSGTNTLGPGAEGGRTAECRRNRPRKAIEIGRN